MVSPSAVSPNNLSQLSSSDASGSICPKGWGMAGAYGDESYRKLLKNVYGERKDGYYSLGYKEFDATVPSNDILIQNVFAFLRIGFIRYQEGLINLIGKGSLIWEKTLVSYNSARDLNFYDGGALFLGGQDAKGFGYSLRCEAK